LDSSLLALATRKAALFGQAQTVRMGRANSEPGVLRP
jgi:hypothetical protein